MGFALSLSLYNGFWLYWLLFLFPLFLITLWIRFRWDLFDLYLIDCCLGVRDCLGSLCFCRFFWAPFITLNFNFCIIPSLILFISVVILLIKHVVDWRYCLSFILSLLYVGGYVKGIFRSNIIKSSLSLRLNLIQWTTWCLFSEAILFITFLILLNECIGVVLTRSPRGRSFFTSFRLHASRQYDLDFIQSGLCLNLSLGRRRLFLLLYRFLASFLYLLCIFSCHSNYSCRLVTRFFGLSHLCSRLLLLLTIGRNFFLKDGHRILVIKCSNFRLLDRIR